MIDRRSIQSERASLSHAMVVNLQGMKTGKKLGKSDGGVGWFTCSWSYEAVDDNNDRCQPYIFKS